MNADLKKSVTLTCLSDEAIDIYFGGNKIVPNARYTVTPRAGIDLAVTIMSVEVGDIGAYTCRSSASPASPPQIVTLQLKRKPFKLHFWHSFSMLHLLEFFYNIVFRV